MKKIGLISIFTLLTAFASPAVASATSSVQTTSTCQPVYGGSQTCQPGQNVVINKTVQNPQNGQFVDNLTVNDPHYLSGNSIAFHITITNTGSQTVPQVTVKDVLPAQITFVSAPGTFDTNSRTLTYTITNLQPQAVNTTTVFAKAADMTTLTQDVTCVTNQAAMTIGSEQAQDNAGFCIDRQAIVTPTQAQPGTTTVSNPTPASSTNSTTTSPSTTGTTSTNESGTPATTGSTNGSTVNNTAGTIPSTTKGGLPVYSAPIVKNTPKTGSEDLLTLLALFPTGTIGYILRKKALN